MNEIFILAKPRDLTAALAHGAVRIGRTVRLASLALATGARMTPLGNNRALLEELSARSQRIRAAK